MSSTSENTENQPLSQNFSISNVQMSNARLAGQAGRDLQANQSQQNIRDSDSEMLTSLDIVNLLNQLREVLQLSDLPNDEKEKVMRNLETAKDEVQAEEPDKVFAAKSLQRATKVLKETSSTVEAGTSLWQKVKPIIESIRPWLGVAASSLL